MIAGKEKHKHDMVFLVFTTVTFPSGCRRFFFFLASVSSVLQQGQNGFFFSLSLFFILTKITKQFLESTDLMSYIYIYGCPT